VDLTVVVVGVGGGGRWGDRPGMVATLARDPLHMQPKR